MEVHIVLYHWCTDEEEGTDVVGCYADHDRACAEMRKHMEEVERRVIENYHPKFDADFKMDDKTYIAFGFYGTGCGMDHSWSGRVETVTVE